jgi:hypothetical protein
LKEGLKGREDEDEGLSSYWMTVWKRGVTEIRKRNHYIALFGELIWKRLWTCRMTEKAMLVQQWPFSPEVLFILNDNKVDTVADCRITKLSATRVFIYSISYTDFL